MEVNQEVKACSTKELEKQPEEEHGRMLPYSCQEKYKDVSRKTLGVSPEEMFSFTIHLKCLILQEKI